jgi:glycosyltransferase involved in cell wall biosynthesis
MHLVSVGTSAPDLTIILPAYQQVAFVQEAVGSVLAQQAVTAEIILSDDHSVDGTYEALKNASAGYSGPHRVLLNRNSRNLGIDHVVRLVEQASCDIVLMAHSDDICEPQRARRVLDEFNTSGASMVSSKTLSIDEAGRPLSRRIPDGETSWIPFEDIIRRIWIPGMLGATLAWRKEVYMRFPRLDAAWLPIGHDSEAPFRAALLNGLRHIHEPLIRRRAHNGQWSVRLFPNHLRSVRTEAIYAHNMSVMMCMLRDAEHLARTGSPAEIERAQIAGQLLREEALGRFEKWIAMRDRLYRSGWRPDWQPRQQFDMEQRKGGGRLFSYLRRVRKYLMYLRYRWLHR